MGLYLEKKKKHKKSAGGVAQGVGPELKPQYRKKKKKKRDGGPMDVRPGSADFSW
jgi:hypothetical protein